jgi:SAM-dependent methyltransferase
LRTQLHYHSRAGRLKLAGFATTDGWRADYEGIRRFFNDCGQSSRLTPSGGRGHFTDSDATSREVWFNHIMRDRTQNHASTAETNDASSIEADARELAETMRAGNVAHDDDFDQFMPYEDRRVSSDYWTPVRVATRAAQWLDYFGVQNVVDVGSGVGKFCVAAALGGRCQFTGIEHRTRLVTAARALARTFDVEDRVDFVRSSLSDVSWPRADAYYLYNPFGENLCSLEYQLDADVELGIDRYKREIADAERFIEHAPRGTFLITYNGFGGRVPDSYEQVAIDRDLPYELRMWRKTRPMSAGRVLRSG